MNLDHLIVESEPAPGDLEYLDDQLYDFNVQQTGVDDGKRLTIFVRDARQTIYAGIDAWTWGGSGEIRSLWVHPSLRGQGVGRKLMQAAEAEARARGCAQLLLGTFSFQAPDFYQSLGYEVLATLPDHPQGHQLHFLYKQLR